MDKKNLIEKINSVSIEHGEITNIDFLEAIKDPLSSEGIVMLDVPARCNVSVTLKPSNESDIKVVVSLPLENWNGKYLGTCNGGAAGVLVMQEVNAGVARGFATANTDMGSSLNPEDMYMKRERWIDFGYRATHLMTVVAKDIIKAFYGKEASRSYFVGCSTGGQQALQEAQMFPEDYDGIAVSSPAYNRVNLHQAFVWDLFATCSNLQGLFAPDLVQKVVQRVLDKFVVKCGGAEGDNFLSYPGKADFSPDDVDEIFGDLGLNDAQKNVLKNIYSFPKIAGTDENIYVPQPLGCEGAILMLPYIKDGFNALLGFLQKWVFGKDFDYTKYDFNKDYQKMVELLREHLDATNTDLSAFKARGGKMILVTGSTDCLIPYTDGKNYYENVVKEMGGLDNVTDFFRYFHIPGLAHGSGGKGLQEIGNLLGVKSIPLDKQHDILEAVMAWVERYEAPEELLPVGFKNDDVKAEVDIERPIYPYPYETEYIGGDRKKKESFRKKLGNGIY